MEPLISIIIPVYNVKQYLKKCVDSVIAQTYKNIEIIIVDDGSTDGSSSLCNEIKNDDNRIKVYHKQNGGLSSARNFGIDKAKGEYIGFVDSDDYIDNDMYEVLLDLAEKNNAEMSMCALYDVYGDKIRRINNNITSETVGREEAIRMVLEAEVVSVTAVNKLYKKELFRDARYPEGRTAEDAFLIIDLLDNCNRVAITTAQKYYYFHRNDSITTRKFNGNVDAIDAYKRNYEIIEQKYPELLDVAKMRLCWANFYVLDHLLLDDREEYKDIKKQVISYLNNNYTFVMRNKQFHTSRKIAATMLRINWRLYKQCIIVQNKRYKVA